jgi:hypothetical protein
MNMTRKPTVYEALTANLGRKPTLAEQRAEVNRILGREPNETDPMVWDHETGRWYW